MFFLNEFEFKSELGKGAFSSVHIVKRKIDGKTYAMKRVKIFQLNTKEKENALNEIRLLASLSHINIIGYKEAFFDEISQTMNIVMELADDGDILSKIKLYIQSKLYFKESTIWSIVIQMLQGMKYLHDNNIMHRDMKSANVFLMKSGIVKIGDLNVSKIAKMGMASTQTGTPFYASPEVWKDRPYDYKSDIWSIGCIIYEMCTLKTPFKGASLPIVFANVQRGSYDPIPYIYSKELSKVISYMLQVNPIARLTCDQLLKSDLIADKMKYLQHIEIINDSQMDSRVELIKTIKVPKNLREINRTLPSRQYDNEEEVIKTYYSNRSNRKKVINKVKGNKIMQNSSDKSNSHTLIKQNNNQNTSFNSKELKQTDNNNPMSIKIQLNYKTIEDDKPQQPYSNKCIPRGVNNCIRIVYSKPVMNNKIPNSSQKQSNITANKIRMNCSPIITKMVNRHLSPSLIKKKVITPKQLSNNASPPSSSNKSANRNINRPISSILNNKQKRKTQNEKKNRNYTSNRSVSVIQGATKKRPERQTSKSIVNIK